MLLKETKKFNLVKSGVPVRIRLSAKSWHVTEGIPVSVKGLNGTCYEVIMDNGRKTYLSWTSIVEAI
jgi:hypothetical protein